MDAPDKPGHDKRGMVITRKAMVTHVVTLKQKNVITPALF
jgi:hypothetical protein